ncbi:hypothetical protein [Aureimonas sp. AU20]|uniref:hypothetical protein n=1 Tax=Aureimonas sp. AU20 TaxID=1349819 RepID=UPI00071EE296|nr:hypothetical protein [Aureimonas sp. AU20]ALN74683.1 hypothetical protein M673_18350 [Aureimonas sp. AU20]
MQPSRAAQLRPIGESDLPEVGRFLHEHMNARIPAESWARAARPTWAIEAPNHGFMLVSDGRIVGAHLAFYSERRSGESVRRICNLAAWCVLREFRFEGLRLLKTLLSQPNYEFTDLSPSGYVVPLNARLQFKPLDTATALVPNLPWPARPGRVRIVSDPAEIEPLLEARDLDIFRDHRHAQAAHHLAIQARGRSCYVIFRRDRRKNLPLFASILHVGEPALFAQAGRHVFSHMLLRHGIPATLAELRVIGGRPWPSVMLRAPRPKMFRSEALGADQIDYLYSELTCVAW